MRLGIPTAALGLAALAAAPAPGQSPSRTQAPPAPATARVETAPLALIPPERYQVPAPLEPARRVALVAPADGILQAISVPIGTTVREGQELVQLDRTEAAARLKIAQAGVKEMVAALEGVRGTGPAIGPQRSTIAMAEARVEAAQGQVELAQVALDRCTLRAPFAGRLLAAPVSPGQYVTKGTTIAELAEVARLRVLLPVDRTAVTKDVALELEVEGKAASGTVRAVLPLPEAFAPLRELATPLAAAWVELANADGALEPGQRVRSPFLPNAPLAVVPGRALRPAGGASGPGLQVIRHELVTDVPVAVLGEPGPGRVQVSGALRPGDALIVEASVPLVAGTLIRFEGDPSRPIETIGPRPDEPGAVANITPPGPAPAAGARPQAAPRPGTSPAPATPASAPRPAPAPAGRSGDVVPF
ncbi:MAG TPA: HlyD family efflux transporter periplasmic adaptor subunit [Isosphaeraceae bacterium]